LGTTLLVVTICLVAVVTATVMVRWPHRDHPQHADAIVVLSGDYGERLALAKRLLAAGVAPTLVLAGQPDLPEDVQLCQAGQGALSGPGTPSAPGQQGGQPFEVICIRPQPDSTRAEAQATAQLAVQRHWKAVVVATSVQHVARSRLLFSRCFRGHGQVQVVGAQVPFGGVTALGAWAHEVEGMLYARIWARHC
jgi:uncharacterized SAM-binding protein YcdF (DUF218 family)